MAPPRVAVRPSRSSSTVNYAGQTNNGVNDSQKDKGGSKQKGKETAANGV
jgi:hypothetical protein